MAEWFCAAADLQSTIDVAADNDTITITDSGVSGSVTIPVRLVIRAAAGKNPTISASATSTVTAQASCELSGIRLTNSASNGSLIAAQSGASVVTIRKCVCTAASGWLRYETGASWGGVYVLEDCILDVRGVVRSASHTITMRRCVVTCSGQADLQAAFTGNTMLVTLERCYVRCRRLAEGLNPFAPTVAMVCTSSILARTSTDTEPMLRARGESQIILRRCTVDGRDDGFLVQSGTLTASACGFIGSGRALVADGGEVNAWNCGVYGPTFHGVSQSGTVTGEPLLDSEYRPRRGSPWIDAGGNVPDVTEDYAGRKVPLGAAHDIGAYEYRPWRDVQPAVPGWIVGVDGGPLVPVDAWRSAENDEIGDIIRRVCLSLILQQGWILAPEIGSRLHTLRREKNQKETPRMAVAMVNESLAWLPAAGGRVVSVEADRSGDTLTLTLRLEVGKRSIYLGGSL